MWEWIVRLFRQSGQAHASPHVDPELQAIVDAACAEMARQSRPVCFLAYDEDRPVGADAHSSIAGSPSLPPDMEWPCDAAGRPMSFLAQLNYADLPPMTDFPAAGLLSVFVADDNDFGCAFPSLNQTGFRCLYFPSPETLERRAPPDMVEGYSPFSGTAVETGLRLTGTRGEMPPDSLSFQGLSITEGWHERDMPPGLWRQYLDSLEIAPAHDLHFDGHPSFTQDDFRYTEEEQAYDRVLLRLGFVRGPELRVCWGDAGEAVFMIRREDLVNRRFERAVFNWDCC